MKEIILDTNVFLRHFVKSDDPQQSARARQIFEEVEKGDLIVWVSILVLNEVIWSMKKYYELKPADFLPDLLKLVSLKGIRFIDAKKTSIMRILKKMQTARVDFTDFYLVEITKGKEIFSFDKNIQRLLRRSSN